MAVVTPTDKIRVRTVSNQVKLIQEHLEAMQRDAHGIEQDEDDVEDGRRTDAHDQGTLVLRVVGSGQARSRGASGLHRRFHLGTNPPYVGGSSTMRPRVTAILTVRRALPVERRPLSSARRPPSGRS